ncbi:MAG: thioesterase family protein [Myxococcales bacterium]
MARVKIDLPERFAFQTELPILIGHINYGHHLDNVALLSLASEARVRFLASMGYTELDVEGVGIILADAAVRYRSEARYGESLVFELAVGAFHPTGCDLVWRAQDKASGRVVAEGQMGVRFFDYSKRTLVAVPEGFKRRFQG